MNVLHPAQYRMSAYVFWDGKKCISVNYNSDVEEYGMLPDEFKTFSEFPHKYFLYGGRYAYEFTDFSMHLADIKNIETTIMNELGLLIHMLSVTRTNVKNNETFLIVIVDTDNDEGDNYNDFFMRKFNQGYYGVYDHNEIESFEIVKQLCKNHKFYKILNDNKKILWL